MNYSERDVYYQTDTGPVLFPDVGLGAQSFIGNFRRAYVAHNGPDWAEFIVNVPTVIRGDISTDHYSRAVRVEGKNVMIAVC